LADLYNDGGVTVGQKISIQARRGAFNEKLNGREFERLGRRERARASGGNFQRRQAKNVLAGCAQRFTTRRENSDFSAVGEQSLRQRGRCGENVLAAIQHQQHLLIRKETDQAGNGVSRRHRDVEQ
jgi:hypothetical protein